MQRSMPATEARSSLPAILDQVEAGDEVVITRHGRPVAVIVSVATFRRRRPLPSFARTTELLAQIAQARANPVSYEEFLAMPGRRTREQVEEELRELRRDRDRYRDR